MTKADHHPDNVAAGVIRKFGGIDAVAKMLRLHRSAVNRWVLPPPTGTGGRVPTRHQQALLDLAQAAGIALSPEDFFTPVVGRPAAPTSARAIQSTRAAPTVSASSLVDPAEPAVAA